jgi:hypothetical protein
VLNLGETSPKAEGGCCWFFSARYRTSRWESKKSVEWAKESERYVRPGRSGRDGLQRESARQLLSGWRRLGRMLEHLYCLSARWVTTGTSCPAGLSFSWRGEKTSSSSSSWTASENSLPSSSSCFVKLQPLLGKLTAGTSERCHAALSRPQMVTSCYR